VIPVDSRNIAFTAILLAAGMALQYFLSLPGLLLTPDVITAFFCLAIILFRPKINEAFAIGIAGGVLSMLIPGSLFSYANLASGPAGALVCYYVAEILRDRSKFAPISAAFSATLVSGCFFAAVASIFVTGTILSRFGSYDEFAAVYLPIVLGTAVLNAVVVQALVLLSAGVAARRAG